MITRFSAHARYRQDRKLWQQLQSWNLYMELVVDVDAAAAWEYGPL
jgi:hypothetical protein